MTDKMGQLQEQERLLREMGDKEQLSMVIGSQADLLRASGDLDRALARLRDAENAAEDAGFRLGIEKALFDQVEILRGRDDNSRLLDALKRQERHFQAWGADDDLADCLEQQTFAVHELGDLNAEFEVLGRQLPIWRRLGRDDKVTFCLGAGAMCLLQTSGDLGKALRMTEEAEALTRSSTRVSDLARTLNTKALILAAMGRTKEALDSARECAAVAERNGLSDWVRMNAPLLAHLESSSGGAPPRGKKRWFRR